MDQIAAMLTKIRNAQRVGHKEVIIPASKLKLAIAKVLEQEGFVASVTKEKSGDFEIIRIDLKYNSISKTQKEPAISGIRRVSKLGQRMYVKKDEVKKVKNGFGIGIISTSKGMMTNEKSHKAGLGGEYICEVW